MEKHEFTDDWWRVAGHLRRNHEMTADLLMDAEIRRIQSEVCDEAEQSLADEERASAARKYNGCVEAAARHFAEHHPGYLVDAIVEAIDDGCVPNVQAIVFAAGVLPANENYN